ncbi:hypothetical protein C8Q76DRAFT_792150 [Earliella scabrosa]|nr:hypothetical protein C8Q76DRAFT_792150 [Earliella scabrosa]
MSPIFSRPSAGLMDLPNESLVEVAAELGMADRRSLMLACQRLYAIVERIAYRVLTVQDRRSPRFIFNLRRTGEEPPPATLLLSGLLLSARTITRFRTECTSTLIVSLTFRALVHTSNLRLIPMLGEVLRFMRALKHFRVEICDDSARIFLAVLKKRGLDRNPVYHEVDHSLDSIPSTPLYLPHLRYLRSSRADVGAAIARYRPINNLVVDRPVTASSFPAFLRNVASPNCCKLSTLSVTLNGEVSFLVASAKALLHSLPELKFLAVRSEYTHAFETMVVRHAVIVVSANK